MRVRALTNTGIDRFESFLERLRQGERLPVPRVCLEDKGDSRTVAGDAEVVDRSFNSRMEAADYLNAALAGIDRAERDHGRGLWAWLALFYFDRLCPADATGARKVGRSYRYVPSTHWWYYYRHLLLGPHRVYTLCGEMGRSMLCSEFGSHGDFTEQIASRQEWIVNPNLVELVDRLYFDPLLGRTKRGAATAKRPGTLRRLIDIVNQLDLTYDLYSTTAGELEALLPAEFDRWKSGAPAEH